jgi:hypothetical protein
MAATDTKPELLNPEGLDLEGLRELSGQLVSELEDASRPLIDVMLKVQQFGVRVELCRLAALDRVLSLGLDPEEDASVIKDLTDAMGTIIDHSSGFAAVLKELYSVNRWTDPDGVLAPCEPEAARRHDLEPEVSPMSSRPPMSIAGEADEAD